MSEDAASLPPREDSSALTVVGVGGSAGSLPALEAFFQGGDPTTDGSGSAYIVVVHLPPEHESHLAAILARSTTMPVVPVTENVSIERNHVYVLPAGKKLEMRDGRFQLQELTQEAGARITIDTFFRTLAETHGPQAAAVVLSGTGADGTLGIRQIKERGGLAVAQSSMDAQFDGMPRSAIATGMVDYVLPAAAMLPQIASYWETSRRMRLPEEAAPSPDQRAEGPDQETAFVGILSHVSAQTGHDFSRYKRATVLRRIGRRLQINGLHSLPTYLDFLVSHPAEVGDLVSDLLISVTQFFRDPEAWEALEQDILPRLFHGKGLQDELRVWVCGCATGEEAYTLAMLLLEQAARQQRPPRIQVFATDMDVEAIARARSGLFPATIAGDVPEERLRRWFYPQHGFYQVRKEVREAVLFASHDVLRDTPFSRLDLITCRNLLIYLNREAQEQVFETFHFALRKDARLMLGPSESIDVRSDLFAITDKMHHLYIRRPVARPNVPPLLPRATMDSNLPLRQVRGRDLSAPAVMPVMPELPARRSTVNRGHELFLGLLERYGPPATLVDEAYDIIHVSNGAGRFLRVADGEPTRNLLLLVHPDLRIELRTALYSAASGQDQVRFASVTSGIDGYPSAMVRMTVRRVESPEGADGYFLITFEELAEIGSTEIGIGAPEAPSAHGAAHLVRQLEEENAVLQRQLHSTIDQYEAMTEEIKASNEELQAMNEEQRSAAEELETSKEELQSVNEELSTVNHELKARIDEIGRTNNDLQNFLASTDIGTLFLDRNLSVKRFTPAAETLFNLIPADVGRPLAHVTHRLDYPNLQEDANRVLARLHPVEREVATTDGRYHFLARLLPYRSLDDHIEGIVLTFVDITERKRAEEELRASEERFRLLVEGAQDYAMFLLDRENRITFWSTGAERLFGWTEGEALGQSGALIFTPEGRERGEPEQELGTALAEGKALDRRWHIKKSGARFWADGMLMRLGAEGTDGNPWPGSGVRGFAKITRDATEQKRSEDELRTSAQALRASEEATRQANEALEKRVLERTQELSAALSVVETEMAKRQELLGQLVSIQEEERRRISRELHDQMGQYIAAFGLGLRVLSDARPEVASEVEKLQSIVSEMGREVHRLAVELRPTSLDDQGLVAALENYAVDWQQRTGLAVDIEVVDFRQRLAPPIEGAVYRIVQEALTNIAKHASSATRVSLLLQQREGAVWMTIEDNGPGFDMQSVLSSGRLGLRGMRERTELLGGTLDIESSPGEGTTLFLRVPLPGRSPS